MTSLYCWFDWDDNTTTVNSINIIKEPRKPINEYRKESKKDLVQKMTSRQKLAAAGFESNDNVQSQTVNNEFVNTEAKKDVSQRKTLSNAGLGSDCTVQTEIKDSGKKRQKPPTSKNGLSEGDKVKDDVKKKKKEDECLRLEAKNKQLQSIILERRAVEKGQEEEDYSNKNILPLNIDSENLLPHDTEYPQEHLHQNVAYGSATYEGASYQGEPYHSAPYQGAQSWPSSQFGSQYSDFQRYTYVGDLMSPTNSNATFHQVESHRELQDKCRRLEFENEELRKENEQLRLQLERSNDCRIDDVLTPRKVECLQHIVSSFEEKTRSRSVVKPKVYKPTPLKLCFEEGDTPQRPSSEATHWEDCVTSSGMKKIRLVPELEVYLTQGQLSQVKHSGSENPRKMIVALLDALFTREQLAQSSAKGSRKAHNASIQTMPLPDITVQAIKQFVLKSFKKDTGEPCLSDPAFNDIINSKCATARRSLKH